MTLSNYQVGFLGRTWVDIRKFGGILDSQSDIVEYAVGVRDGSVPGRRLLKPKDFNLELLLKGSQSDVATARDDLRAACAPPSDRVAEQALSFKLPGWSEAQTVMVRPTQQTLTDSYVDMGVNFITVLVTFHQSDPTLYSLTRHSHLATYSGPQVFTVANAGNYAPVKGENLWKATVHGTGSGLVHPVISTDLSSGQSVFFNGTVPSGQDLIIDASAMTCVLNGVSVYDSCAATLLIATPGFFPLAPGNNSVTFDAASGTGTCLFEWSDTSA